MDVVLALGGVVLGWLLAMVSDSINQRRAARTAATLIYVELMEARAALEIAATSDGIAPTLPSRSAWEAHAPLLIRWHARQVGVPLMKAYTSIASDAAMLTLLSNERENSSAKTDTLIAEAQAIGEQSTQGERAFVAKKIRLNDNAARVMKETSDNYLAGILSHTVPLIDEALAALRPRTGLSD